MAGDPLDFDDLDDTPVRRRPPGTEADENRPIRVRPPADLVRTREPGGEPPGDDLTRWWHHPVVIGLSFLFCFPVGFVLLWAALQAKNGVRSLDARDRRPAADPPADKWFG